MIKYKNPALAGFFGRWIITSGIATNVPTTPFS